MSKDIFDGFPSSATQGGKRATNGGKQEPKDLPYKPPVGPRNKTQPGHSGTNHGQCGSQGRH